MKTDERSEVRAICRLWAFRIKAEADALGWNREQVKEVLTETADALQELAGNRTGHWTLGASPVPDDLAHQLLTIYFSEHFR